MMKVNKLVPLIDNALANADEFVRRYYDGDEKPMQGTKKVLLLLKEEALNHNGNINVRVLRAFCDIGALSVKQYVNTPLLDDIIKVNHFLNQAIPEFRDLEPLRGDFGKGDPI